MHSRWPRQFDKVADMLDLDEGTRQLLRFPQREYHIRIPVRMDDGSVKVFRDTGFSTMMLVDHARVEFASIRRKLQTQ